MRCDLRLAVASVLIASSAMINSTSHEIEWRAERIRFSSWHGHCESGPCGGWIEQWVYEGPDIPQESDRLSVRMNLWLKGEVEPEEPQEVILRYVGEPGGEIEN